MKLKLFFLISVIILVLSFSFCYADINKVWVSNEVRNIIYNYMITHNKSDLEAQTYITNNDTWIETITNYLNSYDYNCMRFQTSGTFSNMAFQFQNGNPQWYYYRGIFTNNRSNCKYIIMPTVGNPWETNGWMDTFWNDNYYYTSKNVFTGDNSSVVRFEAGSYKPTTFFDGPYSVITTQFKIETNVNNNTQFVDINVETGNTLEDVPIIYSNNFGTLYDNTYIYYINDLLGFWYWDGSNWVYKLIYNRNKEQVILSNNNYMYFNYDSDNNNESADLIINNLYSYKNVVYHFSITNAEFDNINAYFIIGDNNTNVVGGSLIISGDYFNNGTYNNQFSDLDNQINNNDNTEDIINSITSVDNVDSTIDSFLSGDINYWSNEIGYSSFENPFSTFLLDLVTNVYNALTQRGDVILDFNHHGTTDWVINTREFITPESDVKNLIKWSLVFFYIYGNYKYFHYLITLIETARIDKAISDLGTDEFYDSDIM